LRSLPQLAGDAAGWVLVQFEFLGELRGFSSAFSAVKSLDLPARTTAFDRRARGEKAAEDAEKFKLHHYRGLQFLASVIAMRLSLH